MEAVYTSLWWKGPWPSGQVKRQHNYSDLQLFTINLLPIFLDWAWSPASVIPPLCNLPHWLLFTPLSLFITYVNFIRHLILLLFFMSGIHLNAGPPQSLSLPPTILQFNCNGLRNFIAELDLFLRQNRICIAALQETFLSESSFAPNFREYSLLRCDRTHGRGGGLAFLIHHSVSYTTVDCSSLLKDRYSECQGIKASVNGSDLVIFYIYLPPVSPRPHTYNPDLSSVLNFSEGNVIICRDLNTHH
jgi:hypothetical protein